MQKLVFFLCLALGSLACLSTAELPAASPARTDAPETTSAPILEKDAGPATTSATAIRDRCATINAEDALHLREGASEASKHLAFMRNGEVLRVISTADPEWWLVQRGKLTGYARSKYLSAIDCK